MYQDGGGAPQDRILGRDDHVETLPDMHQMPPTLETLRRIEERTGAASQVPDRLIAQKDRSAGRQQPRQVGRQMRSAF